jgi:hypothetical protein
MIDRPSPSAPLPSALETHYQGRKILRMISSERTAGSIPSWQYAATPQNEIERTLSLAQSGDIPSGSGPDNALSYQPSFNEKKNEEFTFADLVDMVNPLQHIPVVGHFYRKITGDDIKPVGKIIGGTVFGGPAGFAGGLVNVIVEKETGRDIAGNTIALVTKGEIPRQRNSAPGNDFPNDLPAELLAFADVTSGAQTQMKMERQIARRPIWERD